MSPPTKIFFSGFDSPADPFHKRTLVISIPSEKVTSINPVSKPPPRAPPHPLSQCSQSYLPFQLGASRNSLKLRNKKEEIIQDQDGYI